MKTVMKNLLRIGAAVFLLFASAWIIGCAAGAGIPSPETGADTGKDEPAVPRAILEIRTEEDPSSIHVKIEGNRLLTYTSVKQPFPLSIVLYFPDTILREGALSQSEGTDMVGAIRADELDGKERTTRIEIPLKNDIPYAVSREGNGLMISFRKEAMPEPESVVSVEAPEMDGGVDPSMLQAIQIVPLENALRIAVKAGAERKNYKSFNIREAPSRVVFDIYGLKSPYRKEQFIQVNQKGVKRVRYFGHPDRLRLVIETGTENFSGVHATPVATGLDIQIGEGPMIAAAGESGVIAARPAVEAAKAEESPAWVKRVDFSSEEDGKSTVIIGTTRPIEYRMSRTADRELRLDLLNTNLPDHRQRPLITTRFKSAVDRIAPVQAPAAKHGAMIEILLREMVPYFVEQKDDLLFVHFEPSSIPPKPFEEKGRFAAAPGLLGGDQVATAQIAPPPQVPSPSAEPKKPAPRAPSAPPQKYTGERIALDFYDTDIRNVFRILREVSGKNFAVDRDVTGKVTLSLDRPVPWDQVLDLVLRMNQCGKVYEGDIIRIALSTTLEKEDQLRQAASAAEIKLREQERALEPLITEYIPINYSTAREILPHIEKIITKERGSVSVDERTNLIIITDTAANVAKARSIVATLDKVTPQVIIEARIVEADTNFSREIGTQWGTGYGVQSPGVLNVDGITPQVATNLQSRVGVGPQRGFDTLGGTYGYNMAMNFPTVSDAASIGFNFVRIAGTPFLLNAKIMALESQGEGKLVSAPKIVTLDNRKAVIKQGLRYPYNKLDEAGNTTTAFEDIDLVLEVTPHVTLDQRISLIINIAKKDLGPRFDGGPLGFLQSFTTKEAQTELLVNDGDTVVIGGIIRSIKRESETGLPFLSKVPILGWLFKTEARQDDKEELLIFITPRIVQLEQRQL
jgi:type IV pilus assembly protein PilQ